MHVNNVSNQNDVLVVNRETGSYMLTTLSLWEDLFPNVTHTLSRCFVKPQIYKLFVRLAMTQRRLLREKRWRKKELRVRKGLKTNK